MTTTARQSPVGTTHSAASPIAWSLLLVPATAHVLLHLATNGRYGMFIDEYYYLACARRLAWGYVDHPPLSIAVLKAWTSVFGDGVWSIGVLPTLCGGALVIIVGAIAAEFGGRRFAQLLAATAMAVAGVAAVITGFYSMNAIDLVVWATAWWLLARLLRTGEPRLWLWLGLVLGLGLMNKVGVLVFGLALVVSMTLTSERRWLWTRWPWIAGGIALAIFTPHLIWQATHGWPTLEFIENATSQKIVAMSVQQYFAEVLLEQHPANLVVWGFGVVWLLLSNDGRRFRLLGVAFITTIALLLAQASKPYYAAGAFPVALAAGGCAWERWTERHGRRWARPVVLIALVATWAPLAPLAFPVLSPEGYVRWQEAVGIAPAAQEVGHRGASMPQHYADRFGWEEMAAAVSDAYRALLPEERAGSVVIATNYGRAAALEYWARKYDLPPVVSGHNNYWFWGPPDRPWSVAITVGIDEDDVRAAAEDVRQVAIVDAPWALSRHKVLVVRRLTRPRERIWERLRVFI